MYIKIPVLLGTLNILSKDIDSINILTKTILYAIDKNIDLNRLHKIINLPQKLIAENIEILLNNGTIYVDSTNYYKMTEVGYDNFTLIKKIETLNKSNIKVLVDKFTKKIFLLDDFADRYGTKDKNLNLPKSTPILKASNYIKQYLLNVNPSNSKELAIDILDIDDEKEIENIDVEITNIIDNGGFIMAKINENIETTNTKNNSSGEIIIKRPIFRNKIEYNFHSLQKYDKNIHEQLKKLSSNGELLSSTALNLLKLIDIHENPSIVYYDPKTCTTSYEKPTSNVTEKELKTLPIIDSQEKYENIDEFGIYDVNYFYENYGPDLILSIQVFTDYIYEKFLIEDVIDIYKEDKNE